jgi:hypothetical protein
MKPISGEMNLHLAGGRSNRRQPSGHLEICAHVEARPLGEGAKR